MRKAIVAAAVAAAGVIGVVLAVIVSNGDGGGSASPSDSRRATPATTQQDTSTSTSTSTSTAPTTRPAVTRRSSTAPVDTTSIPLPPPRPDSPRRRTLVVGVVDDALAQQDAGFAQQQVALSHDAGFGAAILSATWARGQRRPPATLVAALRNVARAARPAGMQLFVVSWHGLGSNTPRNAAERADFAAFTAAVVRAVPSVSGVIVGNEPNLSTFWEPQFGGGGRNLAARGYADLLARSYDAVKDVDRGVLVLGGALSPRGADRPGGTRPTHSPTAFIRDLGAAYRASRRSKPLMDAFAFHPYMQASSIPPTATHGENTSITIADYPKLVSLLEEAFGGTAQPGARLPVYYTEFGVQTRVPTRKLQFYDDQDSPARTDSVAFGLQAAYYRRALALAYCQPTVRGLFVFHTFDEASLSGWQSGLYFADRTPKPSLPAFKRSVADLRGGRLTRCRR